MFKCKTCNEEKPIDQFYSTPSGHRYSCKRCNNVKTIDRQKTDQSIQRWKQMKFRYGLTRTDWEAIVDEQKGKCPVCDVTLHTDMIRRGDKRPPNTAVVDHCHDTGEIRGIICHNCNVGIGHLKDDTNILFSAVNYLNRSKS